MSVPRNEEIELAVRSVPPAIRFIFWSGLFVTCVSAVGLWATPSDMAPQQHVWFVGVLCAWQVLLWHVYQLRPWARSILIYWLLMGLPIELASVLPPWAGLSWLSAIHLPIDVCYVIIVFHPRVRSAYTQVPRARWKVFAGGLALAVGVVSGVGSLITRQLINPVTGTIRTSADGWLQQMWDPQRQRAATLLGVDLDHSVLPMVVRQDEQVSMVRLWEPPRQWWFVLTDPDQVLTPSTVRRLLALQGGFSARTLDVRWRQLDYQSQTIAGIPVEQGVLEEDGVTLVLGWRRGTNRHLVYCVVGLDNQPMSELLETPWFQQLLQTDIPREPATGVESDSTPGVVVDSTD